MKADLTWRVCRTCFEDLPWIKSATLCPCCGRMQTECQLCGACLKKKPAYDEVLPILGYQRETAKALAEFKFYKNMIFGQFWVDVLFSHNFHLHEALNHAAWITVPLHWRRYWLRGFNQTQWLLKRFARAKNLTVLRPLSRTRYVKQQSQLTKERRHINLKNAFIWTGKEIPSHVVIFEDVVTTGATAEAVAKVCKSVGVQKVSVVTLLRA